MGIIRLLLAISIVIVHSTPIFNLTFVGGQIAVQTFFIISGFYMSLILNEKYVGSGSYKLFISNRFLRLYPIFWAVLILAFLFAGFALFISHGQNAGSLGSYMDYLKTGGEISFWSWCLLIGSNLLLFGQDLIMFLGLNQNTGNLFFTSDFMQTTPMLYNFLLVPQAWTIGLELLFYLIAPFIVRKSIWTVSLIIAVSFGLRLYFYSQGLNHDPWTYRFLPFELAFFLLGNIAYRAYQRLKEIKIDTKVLWSTLYLTLGIIVIFPLINISHKEFTYFSLFLILLPFIFILTEKIKWDRSLGELSYPVYMCHLLLSAVLVNLPFYKLQYRGIILAVASITFAILLNKFVARPIEKLRQSRIEKFTLKNKKITEISAL